MPSWETVTEHLPGMNAPVRTAECPSCGREMRGADGCCDDCSESVEAAERGSVDPAGGPPEAL